MAISPTAPVGASAVVAATAEVLQRTGLGRLLRDYPGFTLSVVIVWAAACMIRAHLHRKSRVQEPTRFNNERR